MAPVPEVPEALFQEVDEESLLLFKDVEEDPKTLYMDLLILEESESSLEEEKDGPNCLFSVWAVYFEALQQRPLLVKSSTAFILMGCSDLLAQGVEHLRGIGSPCDWLRVLRFSTFGLVGAPWTHYYYDWLDTVLPPTPYPWTWTTTVKVCIDQFIQAPILLAFIILGMGLMQGEGIGELQKDMQKQYTSTLIANWKLWIPATTVNIAFIKPTLRVLYDNLVFFIWTIFLSMMLND